jgi:hypothetical protein
MWIKLTSGSIINTNIVSAFGWNPAKKTVTFLVRPTGFEYVDFDDMDKATGKRLTNAVWEALIRNDPFFDIKEWLKQNADEVKLAV